MSAPSPFPQLPSGAGVCTASRVVIDSRLRGLVPPRFVELMRRDGFRIHQVGRAVYAHRPGLRWVFGVQAHGQAAPGFAPRLDDHHRFLIGRGPALGRAARELVAWAARRRTLHLADGSPLPWWYGDDGRPAPGFARPWRVIP